MLNPLKKGKKHQRGKTVSRAAAGYAQQLKLLGFMTNIQYFLDQPTASDK